MVTWTKHEDVWDEAAAAAYDTPGAGMFAPYVLDPAVERLAALANGGAALEFAIGTGRVAIPLLQKVSQLRASKSPPPCCGACGRRSTKPRCRLSSAT